jgi:uncharacterized DUF497 family protein
MEKGFTRSRIRQWRSSIEGDICQKHAHLTHLCIVATFGVTMVFEWDEVKNRANIRKHGFDFAEAEQMFQGFLLVRPDTEDDYGEERWIGIGMIQDRYAFLAFTLRPRESIRIISLRKANHEERKEYKVALKDGLEAH